jgi:hypothetical protein
MAKYVWSFRKLEVKQLVPLSCISEVLIMHADPEDDYRNAVVEITISLMNSKYSANSLQKKCEKCFPFLH